MRVLLTTQAEQTHMLNMVPLAWALRAAGHEVRLASQPALGPAVARAGLPFVPVGTDHHFHRVFLRAFGSGLSLPDMVGETGRKPAPAEVYEGFQRIVTLWLRVVNEPMLGDLVSLCREWRPDLVVWESTTFAGSVAARACGIPHLRFLWGMDLIARLRGRLARDARADARLPGTDPLEGWLSSIAERFGTDFSEDLVYGRATLSCLPPSLRSEPGLDLPYLPFGYVPYNGRAEVPGWLRTPPDRPRVCLTLGGANTESLSADRPVSFGDLVEELDASGLEVVATMAPAPGQDPRGLPPGVRLVGRVPLHVLLPTCAAVFHHGGAGTYCTALFSATPQLVVPALMPVGRQFDELTMARRLADRGAGATLSADQLGVPALVRSLTALVSSPGARREAELLRTEMRGLPTPAGLLPRLESFLAGAR